MNNLAVILDSYQCQSGSHDFHCDFALYPYVVLVPALDPRTTKGIITSLLVNTCSLCLSHIFLLGFRS
jgi:hypothetical protein